jgi:NAD(P)-dependent dehydrogenase (short-subunit alcohol dehydrogenase family)
MPVPAEFSLPDGSPPIALVTGGARRIGAVLSEALAGLGFRVAIHCNRSRADAEAVAARLAATGTPHPLVVQADLADPDAAAGLFALLPAPPSILVNNASLFENDSLAAFDDALWQRHFDINLKAPARLIQAMAAALPAGWRGLVVNMSDAKLASPNPDFFSYTLSKMGLAGLTELAARALPPSIRVNAIAPAVTLVSGPQSRANFAKAHVLNPLGRGVEAEHLAAALTFLVTTPTVTGQTLVLDAGQRFLALPRDVAYMVEP